MGDIAKTLTGRLTQEQEKLVIRKIDFKTDSIEKTHFGRTSG